jgi:tetratricopeptide (TPR) repeat protein
MVGAFGEVQVMDWGLAKVMRSPTRERGKPASALDATIPPAQIRTGRDLDSETQAGDILGTPSFMPPEQAIGAIDQIDERADVFGLGAILCVMLTGRPPYVADTIETLRQLAARAKLDDAFQRLDASGAEPDLISLAKRCLSPERDDRPRNASEVATAVADLRAAAEERAKQAEIDRAKAEVHAQEQRKRRRIMQVAAALVGVILLAGFGGTSIGLIQARRARDREALAKVNESKRADGEAAAKMMSQTMTRLALDTNNEMVFGLQNTLEKEPGTQALRKSLLESARHSLGKFLDEARKQGSPDHTLAVSHLRMGDIELNLGDTLAAQKEYQAGYEMAARLTESDPSNPEAVRDLSISYEKLGDIALRIGQIKEALAFFEKKFAIDQRRAAANPSNRTAQTDLSIGLMRLGDVKLRFGQTNDAFGFYQQGLAIRQRLVDNDPTNLLAQRELSIGFIKLGDVTQRLGRAKDAVAFYQNSLTIRQRLADADPNNPQAQRDLSISFERLGDVSLLTQQARDALDYFQKALELRMRLSEADPRNAQAQRDLSVGHEKLGDTKMELNRPKDALEHYQKEAAILQRLADADPANAQAQHDLSRSFEKLGDATLELREPGRALAHFQQVLTIRQRLAAADQKDAQAQRGLSISYLKLGDVTLQLGRVDEARSFYKQGLAINQKRAAADPANARAQTDLFVNYTYLGQLEKNQHDYARAAECFANARAVLLPWHEKRLLVGQFANAVTHMEQELSFCRLAEQALANLDFNFTQMPNQTARLFAIRVKALLHRKRPADAVATAERFAAWAETQEKDRDGQRYNAACVFALCGDVEKSLALLEKAKAGGYFTAPRIAHIKQDTDFDGIRKHPRFAAFVAGLEKK